MSDTIIIQETDDIIEIVSAGAFPVQRLAASNILTLTGTSSIPVSSTFRRIRVKGTGGATKITAVPCLAAASEDGALYVLQGTDDTNPVEIPDESDVPGNGMRLSHGRNCVLGKNDTLPVYYDAAQQKYIECFGGRVDAY